eukprot:CAMPEP_0197037526 /NCGR_PEP_ID=MMETSP1384-20130603/14714_1 /TAXON_ID=29189 /ORGANISM="Ammonia sp." /LENGTH=254 /DNA_ID=CAMNT_0042467839 /DNA_START=49 /DNA_END=813 /DNA_ORIENTATION=+
MSLSQQLASLRQFANEKQQNAREAATTFKKFQLELIRNGHKLNTAQDLQAAMEGLEIGAQIAINTRDLQMFDRVITQLKQYYLMENIGKLSKQRQHLMGLYLMYLLTENRLGDFHVEIELLSFADLDSEFIKFPMEIEQSMMEGSYQKIIDAKSKPPNKTYTILLNKLSETVRSEISKSLQAVHSKMPLKDALGMLSLNDVDTLKQHIKSNDLNWSIDGQTLHFTPQEQQSQQLEAAETARDMLEFTSNIETIV